MIKSTKAKLDRGARTVEVLKQDLNKPLKVEKQVAILYALTRGFLDDIPVEDISRFEAEYLAWLDANKKEFVRPYCNNKRTYQLMKISLLQLMNLKRLLLFLNKQ